MTGMFIFRSLDSSERHHARTHRILNKNRSGNLDIDIDQWGLDPLWRLWFSQGKVVRMRDIWMKDLARSPRSGQLHTVSQETNDDNCGPNGASSQSSTHRYHNL